MSSKKNTSGRKSLLTGASIFAAAAAVMTATPAFAQDAEDEEDEAIVVTGTIIRGNANSVSPIGTVTDENMAERGQTTVAETIQSLSGNSAGQLPNSFSANGAFADGASAVSLRGLLTSNTLVLVDGLRPAYYPLADDGTRNFVDLNTISQNVVERIDVLKDGASSTYGADAIAGVVNVITRREFQGLELDVASGWRQNGDGAEQTYLSGILGHGDLGADGFNIYGAFEYQLDQIYFNRDAEAPYNSGLNINALCALSDAPGLAGIPESGVLADGTTCDDASIFPNVNIPAFDGILYGLGTSENAVVRPHNGAAFVGDYQMLNPTCSAGDPVTFDPADVASFVTGFTAPVDLCAIDGVDRYFVIAPETERFSFTGRATFQFDNGVEAYMMGNYYQNETFYTNTPSNIRFNTTPAATGIVVGSATIGLPVYVCGAGAYDYVCDGTEADAVLNPQNPFAGAGNEARLFYRFGDIPATNESISQSFRGAGGFSGAYDFNGHIYDWALELSAMRTTLERVRRGALWYPGLYEAVRQGTYNFVNPELNTDAVRQQVSPDSVQNSDSTMVQAQFNVSTDLFELPGGTAVGGLMLQARYESLNNPSQNSDRLGPENRYSIINPFGASGSRDTQSIAVETQLPIFPTVDVQLSGRYDNYSTGQSNFSPKVGVRFTPLDFITLRGTYSEGFRIPSFAESFADPNTGFITVTAPTGAGSWCDVNHGAPNDPYCGPYGLGLTSVSSADLDPEESTNMNIGVVLRLLNNDWTFSADYYRVEIDGVIGSAPIAPAVDAYYNGDPIPAGFTIIPDTPNPSFPLAPPRIGFVQSQFQNLGARETSGWDLQLNGRHEFANGWGWRMTAEATYVDSYTQQFPGNPEEEYAGTIGPYIITAASGTPQWRGSWTNSLDLGRATLSLTAYYTEGYSSSAEDVGGDAEDCATAPTHLYFDGVTPVSCEVDDSFFVDFHGSFDITDNYEVYLDVSNVFDEGPALDSTTYGAYYYNPAWGTPGILGRYFTIGARARF